MASKRGNPKRGKQTKARQSRKHWLGKLRQQEKNQERRKAR